MFTGIVEEVGLIKEVKQRSERAISLHLAAKEVLSDVKLGDSIAVNGICLTVTSFSENEFTVDVMPETLKATSLYNVKAGDRVNLERSMQFHSRVGGHFVTGHVDTVGEITRKEKVENAIYFDILLPKPYMVYFIQQGSITVDGVSLTVFAVDRENSQVTISLIPHTLAVTTLGDRKLGDYVNVECDVLAKHIEVQMKYYMEREKRDH